MTLEKAKKISELVKEYSRTDNLFEDVFEDINSKWRVKIFTDGDDYSVFDIEEYTDNGRKLVGKIRAILEEHRSELKSKIEEMLK